MFTGNRTGRDTREEHRLLRPHRFEDKTEKGPEEEK